VERDRGVCVSGERECVDDIVCMYVCMCVCEV
jgi:hypothetical protein